MIAPFLVDLDELLELALEFINRLAILFRGWIESKISGRFRRIGYGLSWRFDVLFVSSLLLIHLFDLDLLEHRVLLKLLLHQRLQFEGWRLEKGEGLLKLGCEHLR